MFKHLYSHYTHIGNYTITFNQDCFNQKYPKIGRANKKSDHWIVNILFGLRIPRSNHRGKAWSRWQNWLEETLLTLI